MKVSVAFVRVCTKPEYDPVTLRWMDSYLENGSGCKHDLVVINRCADSPDALFDKIATRYLRYDKGGWDCGAWQFASRNIEADLLVCCNTSTYITGPGWLKRFADSFEQHGAGLYGSMASLEIKPHIRTPCFAFPPGLFNDYPMEVRSREDTYRFESFGFGNGTPNVTQWVRQRGHKAMLVTWDGAYEQPDWRKPPNIFRRGDQSNVVVKDRHCLTYEHSDAAGKAMLERLANGRSS